MVSAERIPRPMVLGEAHTRHWREPTTGVYGLENEAAYFTSASVGSMQSAIRLCRRVGKSLVWGNNVWGQCGIREFITAGTPKRVSRLNGVRVRSAAAGRYHSLVVTDDSTLYSFGFKINGWLGHGMTTTEFFPKKVGALRAFRIHRQPLETPILSRSPKWLPCRSMGSKFAR